ncbi:MAG: SseB family protein [Nannocystis sp.]|nr:SseB family protein [Nannocystis sp.]
MHPAPDPLVDQLHALLHSGGDGNRLLVEAGDHYLLYLRVPGRRELLCEAVANEHLPAAAKLTPAREAELTKRGYIARRGRRNPAKTLTQLDDRDLITHAEEARQIFATAFAAGPERPLRVELHLGEAEPTRNPELLRAMKVLAATREMEARQRVYHQLLSSELLLALAPEPERDPGPHIFEHLQGYPVIGAFTDWDALRLWQPKGWRYRVISGVQLFPLAQRGRYGSLLINRHGEIGGELLMNEIEAIARVAARRLS